MDQTVCSISLCVKIDSVQKYTQTNLKGMSVSVVGTKLWNELDSNLRNIKNMLLFKNKLKWDVGLLPTYVSHD